MPTIAERPDNYIGRKLKTAITRAEVEPWPRLLHNMRATLQTELVASGIDPFVVCKWLGNSIDTATEHYLRVREDDIERVTKAAQNPAQQAPVLSRTKSKAAKADPPKPLGLQGSAVRRY